MKLTAAFQPAVSFWWNEGPRPHQLGSNPYGPRTLHKTDSASLVGLIVSVLQH